MTDTEINEAIALKLGWKKFDQHYQYWIPPTIEMMQKYGERPSHLPLYTKSIAAAWEIVEYPKYCWQIMRCWDNSYFSAVSEIIESKLHTNYSEAKADTAPLAICLAFLKLP